MRKKSFLFYNTAKTKKLIVIVLSFLTVLLVFVVRPQINKKESFQDWAIYVLDSTEIYTFDKIHTPKVTSSDIEQIVYSEENQTIIIELTSDYLEKNLNNTPTGGKDYKKPLIGSVGGSVWLNASSEEVVLIANRNGTVFLSLPQPSTSSFYPEGLVIEDVESGLLISVSNKNATLLRSIIQMIKK
jgi:hypothetical protein